MHMHMLECSIRSLSARRAWIEIRNIWYSSHDGSVALRKESVDRNALGVDIRIIDLASLSARRAWIEITSVVFARA